MQKFRTWLVEKMLAHDNMVAVPDSWSKEFVELAGDKVRNGQTIAELMKEYNNLLVDYFNKCSLKELKDAIKDAGLKVPAGADKETLVSIAVNEYKMRKEK